MPTPPARSRPPSAPRSRPRLGPIGSLLLGLVLLLLAWTLRNVLLLFFAALIAAALLKALADPLSQRTGWSSRLTILLVVLVLLVAFVGAGWLTGQPLLDQLQELQRAVPKAWATARDWLQSQSWGQRVLEWASAGSEFKVPWARVVSFASTATAVVADVFLVLLLGIYLALDPELYLKGTLLLVPDEHRELAGSALQASGTALQNWLLGQGIAMAVVGTSVGVGLAIMGMPLAGAIGLLTGLLEFVPFFGAIASAVLGTLLAFAQGPTQALHVAIFFLIVQQLEGNVLMPLVQRWAARLPPVLSLLAVVVFGSLFGAEGVLLGTPLMLVLMVLIEKLYVEPRPVAAANAGPTTT